MILIQYLSNSTAELLPDILHQGLALGFVNLQYSSFVDGVGSPVSLCHAQLLEAIGAPG